MQKLFFSSLFLMFSSNLLAYSTLDCTNNKHTSYSLYNTVYGAVPLPGAIVQIEEIKKNNDVIYRRVNRIPCGQIPYCTNQQPELIDITPENFTYHFSPESKQVIAHEEKYGGVEKTETYAIKFTLADETWILCDSFQAMYP